MKTIIALVFALSICLTAMGQSHKAFICLDGLRGCSTGNSSHIMSDQFYVREVYMTKRLISKFGWEEVGSRTKADRVFDVFPLGGGTYDIDAPATTYYNCQSSTSGTACTGSDGSSAGVGVVGNNSTVWVTPGRDMSVGVYGPSIQMDLYDSDFHSLVLWGENGPGFWPGVPKLWQYANRSLPWQWAWKICEGVQGKKANCKKLAKDLWKSSQKEK